MDPEWPDGPGRPDRLTRIDPGTPNVARVWNYLGGGRDNFEADRRAARELLAAAPVLAQAGPAARAFARRVIGYLAGEAGIRQFLDVGTGIQAGPGTHEFAQATAPGCRVVYVDNDPMVLSHARAMLRATGGGAVSCVAADARDTAAVIAGARQALELDRPVAVLLLHLLNFIEEADSVVAGLAAALAPGSYLAVLQPAADERLAAAAQRWNRLSPVRAWLRDESVVAGWLAGLHLVEPGIVEVHRWRAAPGDPRYPDGMPLLGAVAWK